MKAWCQRSGRETLYALVLLVGIVIATGRLTVGCQSPVTPTPAQVEAGAAVTDGVCKLIEGVDEDQIVRVLCATVDEVATIVQFVLTLRSAPDAGAHAATAACQTLPGSTLCATSIERAKAIRFISGVRTSRLMLDGGAR